MMRKVLEKVWILRGVKEIRTRKAGTITREQGPGKRTGCIAKVSLQWEKQSFPRDNREEE